MSNIRDITTLSDLLNTSPSPHEKSPRSSNDVSDSPTPESTNVKELLEAQSEKLRVTTQRDGLLAKRATLKEEIEALRIRAGRLLRQQKQSNAQKQLEQALERNDHRNNTIQSPSLPETVEDDASEIIRKLNVLPSEDWNERLVYIRKLCPYMTLKTATTTTVENVRIIHYTVAAQVEQEKLFLLEVEVKVSSLNDSVVSIVLPNRETQLLPISLISQSYCTILINNYIPNKKLNLLMYSFNSLAEMVHTRMISFLKIKEDYPDLISQSKSNTITRTTNVLELEVKKDDEIHIIRLHWDLVLNEYVTGEVESDIRLHVGMNNDENTRDATKLFVLLVKEMTVHLALRVFLKTSLGYNNS